MGKPRFLNLKVYRLAERLADALDKLVAEWDQFHRNTVGEPLVRAARLTCRWGELLITTRRYTLYV